MTPSGDAHRVETRLTPHLRLVVAKSPREIGRMAADHLKSALRIRPDLVLCVPTGASPLAMYRAVAKDAAAEPELFSKLRVLKLDEWGPLSGEEAGSCESYIRKEILAPLGVAPERYVGFVGDAPDPEAECARVSAELERWGGIDLCLLGIGVNGHLGLNEPADSLSDGAHVAQLTESSQDHGMLASAAIRPTFGITLGMGDLLRARSILLLVHGATKREPMERFLTRRITTQFPASLLWAHRDTTVLCDRDAVPPETLLS